MKYKADFSQYAVLHFNSYGAFMRKNHKLTTKH